MKRARPEFAGNIAGRLGTWAAVLMVAWLAAGCGTLVEVPPELEPTVYYHPANVYVLSDSLPASLRRVAVLPVTTANGSPSQVAGVETLQPILQSELGKTKRFEVVVVSKEQLRQWTAEARWRTDVSTWKADEPLPMDFFDKLQKETGSDAVMFCQVTRYQAYQPLAVGWKLTLAANGAATNATAQILWSVDEVVDAGEPQVAKAARTYYLQHVHTEQGQSDPGTILRSPSLYGQFGLSALFGTLPDRGKF